MNSVLSIKSILGAMPTPIRRCRHVSPPRIDRSIFVSPELRRIARYVMTPTRTTPSETQKPVDLPSHLCEGLGGGPSGPLAVLGRQSFPPQTLDPERHDVTVSMPRARRQSRSRVGSVARPPEPPTTSTWYYAAW